MSDQERIQLLLVAQLMACSGMLGVAWIVQLVTYPRFVDVDPQRWSTFHAHHSSDITLVVFPLMLLELGTSLVLAFDRPEGVGAALAWSSVGLAACAWLLTALVSVPFHRRLADGPGPEVIRQLVRTSWLRTATWTVHALVAAAMLMLAS